MSSCLDTDQLLTLGQVMGASPHEGARHLLACPTCQRAWIELLNVQTALREETSVDTALVDRVMHAIRNEGAPRKLASIRDFAEVSLLTLSGFAALLLTHNVPDLAGQTARVLGTASICVLWAVVGRAFAVKWIGTPLR